MAEENGDKRKLSQEERDRIVSSLLRNEAWWLLEEECMDHIRILKGQREMKMELPSQFDEKEVLFYSGVIKGIRYVLSIPRKAKEYLEEKNK